MSVDARGSHRAIEMAGEHGLPIADHVFKTSGIVRGTVPKPLAVPPPVPTVLAVLRDSAAALRSGARMPISLEEGLRAVAIAEACYRSAYSATAQPVVQI